MALKGKAMQLSQYLPGEIHASPHTVPLPTLTAHQLHLSSLNTSALSPDFLGTSAIFT